MALGQLVAVQVDLHQARRRDLVEHQAVGIDQEVMLRPRHARRDVGVDLAATYRLVALYGWDDMIFTHISARVPGPEHHFLINPYGMMFEEITASSLVKIDLDGNKVRDSPTGEPRGFHHPFSRAHGARRRGCVIHLHTTDGMAVSAASEGLLPINQTAKMIMQDLAYHDYEGVALDLDERPRLHDLGDKNIMMLRNHGTLALGTVAEAFLRMYYLERACTMQVRAMPGGAANRPSRTCRRRTARRAAGLRQACSARSPGRRSCASSTASIPATGIEILRIWCRIAPHHTSARRIKTPPNSGRRFCL